jgi:hypothetical protein
VDRNRVAVSEARDGSVIVKDYLNMARFDTSSPIRERHPNAVVGSGKGSEARRWMIIEDQLPSRI